MKNTRNHKKGFTLIELLVVVAIMGMLAALAIVGLNNARKKARDTRRISDIKQIQTALELYFLDNAKYPTVDNEGDFISGKCLSSISDFKPTCSGTTYMAIVPNNPDPYGDGSCGEDEYTDYFYARKTDTPTTYTIRYCIGNAIGEITAGPHYATPAGIADD